MPQAVPATTICSAEFRACEQQSGEEIPDPAAITVEAVEEDFNGNGDAPNTDCNDDALRAVSDHQLGLDDQAVPSCTDIFEKADLQADGCPDENGNNVMPSEGCGYMEGDLPHMDSFSEAYPLARKDGTMPVKYIALWGFPTMFFLALFVMKLTSMKKFYTDKYDANLGYMSVFLTLGVLVDAFTDPAMATKTDNIRSKYGRRRPCLFLGACLAIPIFTLSYQPFGLKGIPATIWYGVFHIGSKLVDTVFMIPHDAWGAEMSPAYHVKSKIFMIRSIGMQFGIIVGALLPVVGAQLGYYVCAFVLSVILFLGTCTLCFFGKERTCSLLPPVERAKWSSNSIVANIISTFLNRPFFVLCVTFVIEWVGTTLPYEILPFIVRGVLGEACMEAEMGLAILACTRMLAQMVSVLFWFWLSGKIGKYRALFLGTVASAILSMPLIVIKRDTYPECTWFKYCLLTQVLQGWSVASAFLVKSLLSDIIDYDELLSGNRREAMYMMTAEFFPKFAQIPCQAMLFYFMAVYKYEKPGNWECYTYLPGEDRGWCDSQRARYIDGSRLLVKFSLNHGDRSMPGGSGLCGNCASGCCTRIDPYQNDRVVWLLKLGFTVVPCICLSLGAVALTFYPVGARDKSGVFFVHRKSLKQAQLQHHQNKVVRDPWFPNRELPPVPSPTAHMNILMHFWPWEIARMLRNGRGEVPDHKVLTRSCTVQLAIGMSLAVGGVGIFAAGWDDLQKELGGSISPIGAMLFGIAVLIGWFNTIRYRAASEVQRLKVNMTELRQHYNYLCRFTGRDTIAQPQK